MAAMEIPQAKSLVCVTSYTNDKGKVVHRNSTFSDVKIDAPVQNLMDVGSAIFNLKNEALYELTTVLENKIVNA